MISISESYRVIKPTVVDLYLKNKHNFTIQTMLDKYCSLKLDQGQRLFAPGKLRYFYYFMNCMSFISLFVLFALLHVVAKSNMSDVKR